MGNRVTPGNLVRFCDVGATGITLEGFPVHVQGRTLGFCITRTGKFKSLTQYDSALVMIGGIIVWVDELSLWKL